MGVRPGYKRTEVGIIPEDWDVSTVGQQFSVQLGKMLDAKRNVGVAKPYLGNRAVQWNRIDIAGLSSVPLSPADLLRFHLEKGDLLACEGGEVGRAAIWDAPLDECYYQKALHRLRPLKDFDSRFMVAILHRLADRGMLANYVTQTSIAHLPRDKFIEVQIPLPPVAEQHAVATAFSDVDALLGGLDRLIAKKHNLKQAAMQQLLTGQTRLPSFHGEWEVKTLKQAAVISTGINKPLSEMGSGALYVTVQDLYDGTSIPTSRLSRIKVSSAEIETRALGAGDIVFGKSSVKRDGIGYPSQFLGCEEAVVFSGFTYRARARQGMIDPTFLFYALRTERTRRWLIDNSQASALTNINQTIADAIPITLPPTLAEQTAIAKVLSDMDAELAALEARRDKTRDLKQAMMQELLTGKTRLVAVGGAPA